MARILGRSGGSVKLLPFRSSELPLRRIPLRARQRSAGLRPASRPQAAKHRPRPGNLKRRRRRALRACSCPRAVPFAEGAMRREEAREFRPLRGRCRSETGAPLPCALRAGCRSAVSYPLRAAKPARRLSRTSHPAHHHNAPSRQSRARTHRRPRDRIDFGQRQPFAGEHFGFHLPGDGPLVVPDLSLETHARTEKPTRSNAATRVRAFRSRTGPATANTGWRRYRRRGRPPRSG